MVKAAAMGDSRACRVAEQQQQEACQAVSEVLKFEHQARRSTLLHQVHGGRSSDGRQPRLQGGAAAVA